MTADTLQAIHPEMEGTAEGILQSFDDARERIHEVADIVYAARHKGSYAVNLIAGDFKYAPRRN